jgi:hypothetical protein
MNYKNLIDKHFKKIIKGIKLFDPPYFSLFNNKQVKCYGESTKSYQGSYLCGTSSFIIKSLLDKEQIPNKVIKSNSSIYINEDYILDHSYILLENDIIIDGTIRQFFIDERSFNINCLYQKYIFEELPPIFIGKYDYLTEINNNLIEFNKTIFNTPLTSVHLLNKQWQGTQDITNKFKLNYFKENHNSLKNFNKIINLF